MFATEINTPICLHNLFTRQIDPIINVCGECGKAKKEHVDADHQYARRSDLPAWHGWHAFRRGCGSNLAELGVPVLTTSKILRHGDVATTEKYYIKVRQQTLREAMSQLEVGIEADRRKAEEAAQSEAASPVRERVN